jgi:hypothetical protein
MRSLTVIGMSYLWRLDPSNTGYEIPAHLRNFASQSDAESWVGEHWREMAAAGVVQVVLLQDTDVLYEMSLSEA